MLLLASDLMLPELLAHRVLRILHGFLPVVDGVARQPAPPYEVLGILGLREGKLGLHDEAAVPQAVYRWWGVSVASGQKIPSRPV